ADLAGKKVCATIGSTTLDNLRASVPAAVAVSVVNRTECLVALQDGQVDAITADDTILYGFEHQDPNTRVLGFSLESEPYGIAISPAHPEFVRFVNAVLDRVRSAGPWAGLHDRLEAQIGLPDASPPQPEYRD